MKKAMRSVALLIAACLFVDSAHGAHFHNVFIEKQTPNRSASLVPQGLLQQQAVNAFLELARQPLFGTTVSHRSRNFEEARKQFFSYRQVRFGFAILAAAIFLYSIFLQPTIASAGISQAALGVGFLATPWLKEEDSKILLEIRALRQANPIRPLIAGNHKMFPPKAWPQTLHEALLQRFLPHESWRMALKAYISALVDILKATPGVDVTLFVTHVALDRATEWAEEIKAPDWFRIGTQRISHISGMAALSGQTSDVLAHAFGAQAVLVGHSEVTTVEQDREGRIVRIRIEGQGDSDEHIVKQIKNARALGMPVVLALGETLDEREAGETLKVLERQMAGRYAPLTEQERAGVDIAYEPIWAIGKGAKAATTEEAQEAVQFLRLLIAKHAGVGRAAATRLLYGGNANAGNIDLLLKQADIDGVLPGSASLDIDTFEPLIRAAAVVRSAA